MAKRSNTTSIPYAAKKKTFWQLLWKQKALCIMALAPLIMLIIFKYVPMYGILIAFKNYKSRASTITPMKHSAIINVPGTTIAHSSEKPIRYSDVDRLSVRKGYDSR